METANIDSLADVFMSYLDADSLIIEGMDYLKRSIIGEACCIELIRHYINNEKLTTITSFDYPWESRLLKSLCKDFRLFYTSMEGALCEYVGGEFDELLIQ